MRELPPLFMRHLAETDPYQKRIKIDVNWQQYFALELNGFLHCLTCRLEGKLIGYHFVVSIPELRHASSAWAISDMVWLAPEHRRGLTGYLLFSKARAHLAEQGVRVHQVAQKLHMRGNRDTMGKILKRLGYKPTDVSYSAVLG